ncbi:tRNA1(Val) (adenine(37)-N6)-methyltransferase [Alteribacillus sp. HJP-4]|uniref:tRNA1(Val) (adenine(37)-N6)-methyltransferase n=1 Tax=Alteribacillus sp. HJP-4 TaxID=2775394 RepID=UPI0035CCD0FA
MRMGERLDYITEELLIIQSEDVFSFSIDAVLLARFCYVPKTKGRIVDLCSGNGVIPFVLTQRSSVPIIGVELQKRLCDMAERSAVINQTAPQVSFLEKDVRELHLEDIGGAADLVTCNPPYFATPGRNEENNNPYLLKARHERNGVLLDFVRTASQSVKEKGKVAMVLRPERLLELMNAFRTFRIEPKRMKCVHPKSSKEANMILLEGIKCGKKGMSILPPLVVYHENGSYTKEFRQYYDGEN